MNGEFEFIAGIRKMFPVPQGMLGIGDDCAVIPQEDGMETLVSTDMLVEGSHFLLEDIGPRQLGWKSAAANFSDIAAMGGSPVGSFLALALPSGLPQGWTDAFLTGFKEISDKYGFALLGGDTTASKDRLCICVTVLGRAVRGRSLKRSGARPGDLVCMTGTAGDSAAGLYAILHSIPREEEVPYLTGRHYLPTPRIKEGMMLASTAGIHSMMDISDGIGSDLRHIMEESGTGMEIDLNSMPLSKELKQFCRKNGLDPFDFAADGGEDYELLFTADPSAEAAIQVQHSVIGKVTDTGELVWKGTDKDFKGFRHF